MSHAFCTRSFWVLFILTLNLKHLSSGDENNVLLEAITDSSPCSATCGLGIKSQTLCFLNDSNAALEEGTQLTQQTQVTQQCRVRKVKCVDSWQCGLRTLTATEGQRLSIDCVEEVMKELGPYAWRVSWRYARGVITSDDSLFARWQAPKLDHMMLDPVKEKDAGTYRCDVQDAGFRRVKRVYWGVRVLPPGVINLDMQRTVERHENHTHSHPEPDGIDWRIIVYPSFGIVFAVLGLAFNKHRSLRAGCFQRLSRLCGRNERPPTSAIPMHDLQMAV